MPSYLLLPLNLSNLVDFIMKFRAFLKTSEGFGFAQYYLCYEVVLSL